MINCAVIGATGYTGIELIKILARHPHVNISALTTRQKKSIPARQLVGALPAQNHLEIRPYTFQEVKAKADCIFLCLPHTEAIPTAAKYYAAGKVVIDLSADFRLKDPKDYLRAYGVKHSNTPLLKKAVYGLPERHRKEIRTADLIANPGCYPTSVILAIAPLLDEGYLETESIIIDSKSGVSGAGKKLSATTQFCEVTENFFAYKVGKHQHMPEIEQALSRAARKKLTVTFVPHLLPVERGILSTIYLKKKKKINSEKILRAFLKAYEKEPFVRVKGENSFPTLRDVRETNYCDIGFTCDSKTDRVIVISAIDNLLKGASGQAVQNMNIRFGFPELEGLGL